jgi:ferredoxin
MNAQIDRDGCIGCGLCCEICPEVFRLADDNLSTAYAPVSASVLQMAQEAQYSCPVAVIHLEE